MRNLIRKILFRNGHKNNSPRWAFLEGFEVPDIKNPSMIYLARIRLIQTPWFGVYVHRINAPDARTILHSHPWAFTSFLLRGQYTEMVPGKNGEYAVPRRVKFINVKPFNRSWHWIDEVHRDPVWTLVFVGKRKRVWGYLEPTGEYFNFDEHPINDTFVAALANRGSGDLV